MVQINHSATNPEIFIYDEIGPSWIGMIDDQVINAALGELKGSKAITVRINSPGGDVFAGRSIANALKRNSAKIHVEVDGIAASIASIIALAGDTVSMASDAMFMIHEAWSITMGNKREHKAALEALSKIDETLVDTYHQASGIPKDELHEMIEAETWLTASEAVEMGFADGILDGAATVAARIPEELGFKNIPARLRACVERREKLRRETRPRPTPRDGDRPNLRAVEARRQARAKAGITAR